MKRGDNRPPDTPTQFLFASTGGTGSQSKCVKLGNPFIKGCELDIGTNATLHRLFPRSPQSPLLPLLLLLLLLLTLSRHVKVEL
jgi:hypothetical protein